MARPVALLTGASRGLGEVIARRLAAAGWDLVLVARDAAKLAEVAASCAPARVVCIGADVTVPADRARLLSEAGPIDALINNAGVEVTLPLVDHSEADVAVTLETNLHAPIALTRLALPPMLARGRGAIVHVSSMSGKGPTPWNAVYAASKHGLVGFTSSLQVELHGTGVHVGVVCPGFVSGQGMWASTGVKAPLALREVTPEQVADAVLAALAGAPEVLVTSGPIRPLLALQELFPSIRGPVMRRLGIVAALRERAEKARG
jgi:short-subunit dehydrogenase